MKTYYAVNDDQLKNGTFYKHYRSFTCADFAQYRLGDFIQLVNKLPAPKGLRKYSLKHARKLLPSSLR